eukprot:m.92134 g.92134  ORF g.92134 m.92134 type:complete len:193 (-) comp8501_c3_seq1:119-697(-)
MEYDNAENIYGDDDTPKYFQSQIDYERGGGYAAVPDSSPYAMATSNSLYGDAGPARPVAPAAAVVVQPVESSYLQVASSNPVSGPMPGGTPWFRKDFSRQDAESALVREAPGRFVVRPGRKENTFVLSIKLREGFSHLEITPRASKTLDGRPSSVYILGAFSQPHATVEDIVKYHRTNAIEIEGRDTVFLKL